MQTEAWEQFQRALGRDTYRFENALFIKHELRFGASYWYSPRLDKLPSIEQLDQVFQGQTKFVLTEPQQPVTPDKPWGTAPTRQPRQTLYTDLTQPIEKLLAHMKSKTRYNIGLAERKGQLKIVHIAAAESVKYLPVFMQLTQETNLRNQIKSHPDSYYQSLLSVLGQAGLASMHIAYQGDQAISALILIRHLGVATYLFGASSSLDRNTMASYLLQWQTMLWAKEQGDTVYDWWGIRVDAEMAAGSYTIDANLDQIVPTPGKSFGVTRFKLGFGGRVHIYPSAYVRSYSGFWYNAFKLRSHPGSFSY
jgi:lipid II:glycine glycyltransferase (peptidoglycan interpeptide bridge formation enzyme)